MFISIIIPTHIKKNNFIFFKECIKSVYKQSLNKFSYEIIVIDNGSKIKINKFIDKIKIKFSNFTYIYIKNRIGPGIARNIGIKKAKGEYLLFLDSDDMLPSDCLEKYHDICVKKKYDAITSNWSYLNSKRLNRKDFKYLKKNKFYLMKKFISMNFDGSVIFTICKRKIFFKNKIKFESGFHEDITVIFKIYYIAKTIYINNSKMYIKRNTKSSIMNSFDKERIFGYCNAWKSIKTYIIKKKGKKYFENKLKKYYLKGILGLIAIMVLENNKLNKSYLIRSQVFKVLISYIRKFFLKDLNSKNIYYTSKYDLISKTFIEKFVINKNKLDFKKYDINLNL
tara:strand:+ start:10121 stop:11137 length:1017 start_codon:yes stop_codon:yes gene_type:complete